MYTVFYSGLADKRDDPSSLSKETVLKYVVELVLVYELQVNLIDYLKSVINPPPFPLMSSALLPIFYEQSFQFYYGRFTGTLNCTCICSMP